MSIGIFNNQSAYSHLNLFVLEFGPLSFNLFYILNITMLVKLKIKTIYTDAGFLVH